MQFNEKESRIKLQADYAGWVREESEKRKQIAAEKGIPAEIMDKENISYKLVLLSGNSAIYINGGDDVLVMDTKTKELLNQDKGLEKYAEVMDKVINQKQEYEYGELFVYNRSKFFSSKGRSLEMAQTEGTSQEQPEVEMGPKKKGRSR